MLKVFCAPSRYTQGPDATAQLGREIRGMGLEGPAIIVAGRSAMRLLSATWARTFAEAGMRHEVFAFSGECTAAEILRGGHGARDAAARVVIGAGSGKVLDTARANRWQFSRFWRTLQNPLCSIITCCIESSAMTLWCRS